jgi:XdhC and CoxI family
MTALADTMDLVSRLKAADEAFVLATVVRTVSVTAAKAGAKAVIRSDGRIAAGWIGGGCAQCSAVSSGYPPPPRGACAVSRAVGWASALLIIKRRRDRAPCPN